MSASVLAFPKRARAARSIAIDDFPVHETRLLVACAQRSTREAFRFEGLANRASGEPPALIILNWIPYRERALREFLVYAHSIHAPVQLRVIAVVQDASKHSTERLWEAGVTYAIPRPWDVRALVDTFACFLEVQTGKVAADC